jgi:hypothetical protein
MRTGTKPAGTKKKRVRIRNLRTGDITLYLGTEWVERTVLGISHTRNTIWVTWDDDVYGDLTIEYTGTEADEEVWVSGHPDQL